MRFIKENWFKLFISLGVLVITGSFAYYTVVLPNQKEKTKAELVKQQNQKLEECLNNQGITPLSLFLDSDPAKVDKQVADWQRDKKSDCYKRYPIN